MALDIAQEKHTGYLRCPDGTEIKPFEFSNNHEGFDQLWECICQTTKTKNLEDVVVGIESTGPYAESEPVAMLRQQHPETMKMYLELE